MRTKTSVVVMETVICYGFVRTPLVSTHQLQIIRGQESVYLTAADQRPNGLPTLDPDFVTIKQRSLEALK